MSKKFPIKAENAVGYVLPGAVYSHTRYIRGDSSWDVFDGYKVG